MKHSKILLEAAKLVDGRKQEFGCLAISRVESKERPEALKYFTLFDPQVPGSRVWFKPPNYDSPQTPEAIHAHRVLSLIMATTIAKSEGE